MTPNYDSLQLSPLAVIITVVFYAAVYVWLSFALAQVFKKQGIPGWKAWVPVYSAMTFLKLGGQSVIWVFLAVLPIVGIVSAVFFIFALNGVSKRFGKGPGFTVLGVFLYGIWVSILGFGKAQAVDPNAAPVYEPITKVPYGAPPIAQPPRPATPSASPGAPISAAPVVSPVAPPPPPAAPPVTSAPVTPFAPGLPSGPAPIISAAPGFAPAAPAAPTPQPLMQPYGQVPTQGNPWAPPGTPVAAAPPARPAPIIPAPVIPVQAPVQPVPLHDDLDDDEGRTMLSGRAQHDDDEGGEHTVIVGRRSKQWILTTDDGQNIRLSSSTALLGRNPTRDRDFPDAQLVPLNDTAKTVSKTHARIELVNGAWQVVDLDSTNGVVLFMKNEEIELQSGVAAVLTERFLLGELPVRIHQES